MSQVFNKLNAGQQLVRDVTWKINQLGPIKDVLKCVTNYKMKLK